MVLPYPPPLKAHNKVVTLDAMDCKARIFNGILECASSEEFTHTKFYKFSGAANCSNCAMMFRVDAHGRLWSRLISSEVSCRMEGAVELAHVTHVKTILTGTHHIQL